MAVFYQGIQISVMKDITKLDKPTCSSSCNVTPREEDKEVVDFK